MSVSPQRGISEWIKTSGTVEMPEEKVTNINSIYIFF